LLGPNRRETATQAALPTRLDCKGGAPHPVSDPKQQIVVWCRDGDQQAFRSFYREQSGKLWKFLIARGCDRETAYDLLAEAFLRFVQNVCRDPHAPVALLYRIALNLRVDAYRRERTAATEAVDDLEGLQVPAPEEPEDYHQLRALVKTLPESEQNLLLIRYWIGLSHKEVAQALGMPEGTVRRQCAELIAKLRDRWSEDETPSTD
jgi:RNA polymerase sigma factor (sigma-70 family)